MINLTPIKARLAAATPGHWYQGARPDGDPIDGPNGDLYPMPEVLVAGKPIACTEHTPDAAFIACAPGDIAALVAEVERLREIRRCAGALAEGLASVILPPGVQQLLNALDDVLEQPTSSVVSATAAVRLHCRCPLCRLYR